jgi:hypothetical protein
MTTLFIVMVVAAHKKLVAKIISAILGSTSTKKPIKKTNDK